MRTRIVMLVTSLLVSFGAIALNPSTAMAAARPQCRVSAIDGAASSLAADRKYLTSHRSSSSWSRYVPGVVNTYTAAANCFSGGARTLLGSYQRAFLADYRAKRWSGGIAELDATIRYLGKIVSAYRDADRKNPCPEYC